MNIMSEIGRSKYTEWALNIVLVVMLIMVGLIVYWNVKDYEVIVPQDGNYAIDKTEYHQGEVFNIHLRICKNMDFREDVYGKFIDGVIYSVPENTSDFETGCYDTVISSVKIPDSLPEGSYYYEETVVYRVNPLKEVTYNFRTPEFRVVED